MPSRTLPAPCLVSLLLLTIGATSSRAADPPAATVTDDGKAFVHDNGLVSLTLAKRGGQYHVAHVTFDAGRLKKGANEITLGHAEAVPAAEHKRGVPGQVMYDGLRLEVDPDAADK